jgi:hypothetical protein
VFVRSGRARAAYARPLRPRLAAPSTPPPSGPTDGDRLVIGFGQPAHPRKREPIRSATLIDGDVGRIDAVDHRVQPRWSTASPWPPSPPRRRSPCRGRRGCRLQPTSPSRPALGSPGADAADPAAGGLLDQREHAEAVQGPGSGHAAIVRQAGLRAIWPPMNRAAWASAISSRPAVEITPRLADAGSAARFPGWGPDWRSCRIHSARPRRRPGRRGAPRPRPCRSGWSAS